MLNFATDNSTRSENNLTKSQLEIANMLIEEGILNGPVDKIQFSPLSGGVSSDIFLVSDGNQKIVVKQAVKKLRVKDDWYVDVTRNHFEHEYLRYVARLDANVVPKVLYHSDEKGFFVMEYLSNDFFTWKANLLKKKLSKTCAQRVGEILGKIHRESWGDKSLLHKFDTTELFIQLRVDPYLYTTGKRTPEFCELFEQEGKRLILNRKCLVHGDYSPKNILISNDRVVIIDCEVAWFGDPAFDVCFLLNHLFLKAIYNNEIATAYMELARLFWDSYTDVLGKDYSAEIEKHVGRLLLMLMAARVDGKSPVEYLVDERKKQMIRAFVKNNLTKDFSFEPVRHLSILWANAIKEHKEGRHENSQYKCYSDI